MTSALPLMATVLWLVWMVALLVFRRRPELRVGTAREFVYPIAAMVIVLAWLLLPAELAASRFLTTYLHSGLITAAFLTAVWLLSLVKRDCGIMDVAYPLAVAIPVTSLVVWRGQWSPHETMIVALVALWSLRMSLHIGLRNRGHGEDGRYAAWRRRFGGAWWWWSYFQVFIMQGVTVWLWSLGLVLAVASSPQTLGWQHALTLALFGLGFYFQVVGDLQLERFKANRTDRRMVLDTGLWRLSRHPNYFGEAVVWWSFGALGLMHPWGWLALVCPLYVTWFMSAGSATPMQDRYLAKTKPAYAAYMARVPAFFPWRRP